MGTGSQMVFSNNGISGAGGGAHAVVVKEEGGACGVVYQAMDRTLTYDLWDL